MKSGMTAFQGGEDDLEEVAGASQLCYTPEDDETDNFEYTNYDDTGFDRCQSSNATPLLRQQSPQTSDVHNGQDLL